MIDIFLSKIEAIINRILFLDPDTLADLETLTDKVFYMFPGHENFHFRKTHNGNVDVKVRGTSSNMFLYWLSAKKSGTSSEGEMEIIGDIALVQHFQSILKKIKFNWEEYLSHRIGDTLAYKMANIFRDSVKFIKKSKRSLEFEVSEYFHNENGLLPEQSEVDAYINQIDNLRNDIDRLETKISKLNSVSLTDK